MILVAGGTGDLGRRITDRLVAQGEEVRLLARPKPGEQDDLPGTAEQVIGDLKDPESLVAACAGVDIVVTTANATARSAPDTVDSVDLRGNLNLIEAAEAAGVDRFLFVSALGAHPDHPMPLLRAKAISEQRLRASGMVWTVLQSNVFMDKLIPLVVGEPALSHRPVTLVGTGRRRHSFVAMDDVAAYALAALHHPDARRQTIVVAGPEPLSWYDIVTAFENELGRRLPVRLVTADDPSHQLPSFAIDVLAALDTYDSPINMAETISTFGVEATHLGTFIRDLASTGLLAKR